MYFTSINAPVQLILFLLADNLTDILKEDSYPDVQAFMATCRETEAIVEHDNRSLAEWERQVREKNRPKLLMPYSTIKRSAYAIFCFRSFTQNGNVVVKYAKQG